MIEACAAEDRLLLRYPLPSVVAFSVEALGSRAPTTIGVRSSTVHLPKAIGVHPPVLYQPPLTESLDEEPKYSDGMNPDEDDRPESPWGYAISLGSTTEPAEVALSQFVVAFDGVAEACSGALLKECLVALPTWFSVVKDWCEVLTGQDLDYLAPRQRVRVHGHGWTAWHGTTPVEVPHTWTLDLDDGKPLTRAIWERILELAAVGSEPAVEHLLLRDARSAQARGQYRRAVLDASTALEIALYRVLRELHGNAPSPLGGELIRAAEGWTLGRLVETVRRLGLLPSTVTGDLVTLRNEVAHKTAKKPSKQESQKMLAGATDEVALATPLDPYL